jgi:hypothetical protein
MLVLQALPLRQQVFPDESGLSACLRSASANGVNLHWLRRQMGLTERVQLRAEHAYKLAGILQIDVKWLQSHLINGARTDAGWVGALQGFMFSSKNHLRGLHPQVCSHCIHERGYGRDAWEYTLLTSCSIHGTGLSERCEKCKARLRWDRPAIDLCVCKWPLSSGREKVSDAEEIVASLVEDRLRGREMGGALRTAGIPGWLSELSVDGLFSMIHAFGSLKDQLSVSGACIATKRMPSSYWKVVVCRAIERLRRLQIGDELGELAVSCPQLFRLAVRGVCLADRDIAAELLELLPAAAISYASKSIFGQQGDLFGWTNTLQR